MARKLVAILAADVIGYSQLMERDEPRTFARLKNIKIKFLIRLSPEMRVESSSGQVAGYSLSSAA
jgi:hypothetical protein